MLSLRHPFVVLGLLAVGCTSSDETFETSPATRPPTTVAQPPTFDELQDALESAMAGGSLDECPFEITAGEFVGVLGEVFDLPDRPFNTFASGRLDGSESLPRCTVDWGRDQPSVSVTAVRKPYSGVAGFVAGPRAVSAGEDNEHVACRTTLVLGDFDVIVEIEQRFTACSAVEPIAERLVLAAATSLVTSD